MKKTVIFYILSLMLTVSLVLSGCQPSSSHSESSVESLSAESTVSESTEYIQEEKQLINLQTVWKYLDDGSDPAGTDERTSWTLESFDDSNWKSNEGTDAMFGSKNGEQIDVGGGLIPTVLLNHYQEASTAVPAYFFRTSFELDMLPADNMKVVGTVRYDDAVIIYINGVRVAAFDEPEGGFETNLSYGGSGAWDPVEVSFTVDRSVLKKGVNTVAVELHQQRSDSSDIYFDMSDLSIAVPKFEYLTMNVGADETMRNFTWYYVYGESSIQYAVRNGDAFPEEYVTVASDAVEKDEKYIHRATVSGLSPDTEYVYRVVSDTYISENFYFKTDPSESFNFIYVGDAQIGASGGAESDMSGWSETLSLAEKMFPETSILISAGDQVETYDSEVQYGYFLQPEILSSLAIATSIGNHDTDASLYTEHFNNPNTTINGNTYGATTAGGDYWYTYNNTLFVHFNSNNLSVAEHSAFAQSAVLSNPDVTWRIAVIHHSMFGAHYYTHELTDGLRNLFSPIFEKFGFDVVLNGHEHLYARSYMIEDVYTPVITDSVEYSVTDPDGILYLTAPSSSGSKYYTLLDDASIPHVAVKEKDTTAFTNIEVTDTSFKFTTYRVEDGSVLDTFEIIKTGTKTEETPDWTLKMTETLKAEDFTLVNGTSYAGGAVTAVTYEGNEAAVTVKNTNVNIIFDNGCVKLVNGDLVSVKEGTATVSFSYTAQTEYGLDYVVESAPVTVTVVPSGDKALLESLADVAGYAVAEEYNEVRYTEIKDLYDKAMTLIGDPSASDSEISGLCVKLSNALADHRFEIVASEGAAYTSTEPNYTSFSGRFQDDGVRLTDGKRNSDDPTNACYSAWNNSVNPVEITLDLGKAVNTNTYTVYTSGGGFWGISNAKAMTVYGSSDGETFTELGSARTADYVADGVLVDGTQSTLHTVKLYIGDIVDYRFIKFEIQVNGNFIWLDEVEASLTNG